MTIQRMKPLAVSMVLATLIHCGADDNPAGLTENLDGCADQMSSIVLSGTNENPRVSEPGEQALITNELHAVNNTKRTEALRSAFTVQKPPAPVRSATESCGYAYGRCTTRVFGSSLPTCASGARFYCIFAWPNPFSYPYASLCNPDDYGTGFCLW